MVLTSSTSQGSLLTAQFTAARPGTSTVTAYFAEECSGSGTTPCTIPPQGWVVLTVTVIANRS